MEALILSCGTGGGHNSACLAIEQEMSLAGHNVTILNPYLLKGAKTAETVNQAYNLLVQKAPSAFGVVYRIGNAYRNLPVSSPVYQVNGMMVSLLNDYLHEHHFDAVISTHLFPAEILTNMKRHGHLVPATYFIATDYTCIPFTEETDCDYYVVPAEELVAEFASRGIPKERIVPIGIPVGRQFRERMDKDEARRLLGLDPQSRYILVAGGSVGAGQIGQIVSLLLEHYHDKTRIIVICGNNNALYRHLRQTFGESCTLLEYTSQMAAYMCACDIFISKPGGLSSTEAAVSETPLIHISPIPGCETRNMDFFEKHGMCYAVKSPKTRLTAACDLLLDPRRRQEMEENQRKFIPADAATKICRLIEQTN